MQKLVKVKEKKCVYDTERFIRIAIVIHGNKYDYSITKYVSKHIKIKYICPEHGIVEQTPHNHIYNKHGCHKCGLNKLKNSRRKTTNEFIEDANLIYNFKYNYSKVEYINNNTDVIVICPEHGKFKIKPNNHLFGYQECKICKKNEK